MRIAVVSMPVRQGCCEENFKQMCQSITQARRENAQLIVFAQNVISGYALGDLWLDQSFCELCDSYNARIQALAQEIAIVWGNVRYRGGRLFNTAFFAYRDQLELRVKGYDGELCNDARYFQTMESGELIEYGGELIALNFHEELQLATLNVTIDASPHAIMPKGASQIYVNAGGIWMDEEGVHQLNGRCFISDHARILHFSEYSDGCFIIDHTRETPEKSLVFADAATRIEKLLKDARTQLGAFSLPAHDGSAQRFAKRYACAWLLEEAPLRFVLHPYTFMKRPALLNGFSPQELEKAQVIDHIDDLGLDALFIAAYMQTHSLRGVCYHAMQDGLDSAHIQRLLRDPAAFVDALLACMRTYYAQRLGYRMSEEQEVMLRCELLAYLQKGK